MKSSSIHDTNGSTPTRGYLGHQRPYSERAFLAARHYVEGLPIYHPTRPQVAFSYRVELADMVRELPAAMAAVKRERKAATAAVRREHNGHNGNGHTNGHAETKPTLAEQLVSASFAERVAAAQALGVDAVWYSMIELLVGNGKAAE